ncbi:hypothetical protein JNUCC64_24530 [Streptomyces sp. JNUCC 64]
MEKSFVVHVDGGLFCLSGDEEVAVESTRWSNGLLAPMDHGAWILTGIHTGSVTVRAENHPDAPPVDPGPWEEIVEASVHSPDGEMSVDPGYVVGDPPYLASRGTGWYRLRVYAHGRGLNPDGVNAEPAERYLIQSWPRDWTAQRILRPSPRIGSSLAATSGEPTGKPRHRPSPEPESPERTRLLQHLRNR